MQPLADIYIELQKLQNLHAWGRMQNDEWDRRSKFIYDILSFEKIKELLSKEAQGEGFEQYVWHRWYNFWSAKGIEQIFAQHPIVQPEGNKRNPLVDFKIQGIPFDHKTTVFPKGYPQSLSYAQQYPQTLIEWLYQQQSKQQRYHLHNRLFIVLHAADGQHWRLRAHLPQIAKKIHQYLQNFEQQKLQTIHLGQGQNALSAIIWYCC